MKFFVPKLVLTLCVCVVPITDVETVFASEKNETLSDEEIRKKREEAIEKIQKELQT